MIPLQKALQQRARKLGLPLDTVAKDYVIGHLLAAISAQPELGSALVFKGGTALKKLYFGDYRFSEDLDYTAVKAPSGKALEAALRRAVDECVRTLSERGPFTAVLERGDHRDPHPGGQESPRGTRRLASSGREDSGQREVSRRPASSGRNGSRQHAAFISGEPARDRSICS